MFNPRQLALVVRFEVLEALHSRLLPLLFLLYGGGSLLGSSIFLSLLQSAEDAARQVLAEQMQLDPDTLPDRLVQEKAMPWLLNLVQDDGTRAQLLEMDPLSIFFGFATLQSVALLVLLGATGTISRDVASGAARFVLVRTDRLTWALGKTIGQAGLLALGLLLAALGSALAGVWVDDGFEANRLFWLLRTAFRSWLYGLAYLGIFVGVSMLARTPLKARAGAVLAWFVIAIGHSMVTADWLADKLPGVQLLAWIFPSQHQAGLWSGNVVVYAASVTALLGLAALGFVTGYQLFARRDA